MFSFRQTTNTDVFSRVVRCAAMSMTGEVHIICYSKYIQLLKKSPLYKETTFTFFSRYKVFSSNNIINIFFAQDNAPPQAMKEHCESHDDKGKGNIIVFRQERIALEILIVQ